MCRCSILSIERSEELKISLSIRYSKDGSKYRVLGHASSISAEQPTTSIKIKLQKPRVGLTVEQLEHEELSKKKGRKHKKKKRPHKSPVKESQPEALPAEVGYDADLEMSMDVSLPLKALKRNTQQVSERRTVGGKHVTAPHPAGDTPISPVEKKRKKALKDESQDSEVSDLDIEDSVPSIFLGKFPTKCALCSMVVSHCVRVSAVYVCLLCTCVCCVRVFAVYVCLLCTCVCCVRVFAVYVCLLCTCVCCVRVSAVYVCLLCTCVCCVRVSTVYVCLLCTCVCCVRVSAVYVCLLCTCVCCVRVSTVYVCLLCTCVCCVHVFAVYVCLLCTCVCCVQRWTWWRHINLFYITFTE